MVALGRRGAGSSTATGVQPTKQSDLLAHLASDGESTSLAKPGMLCWYSPFFVVFSLCDIIAHALPTCLPAFSVAGD